MFIFQPPGVAQMKAYGYWEVLCVELSYTTEKSLSVDMGHEGRKAAWEWPLQSIGLASFSTSGILRPNGEGENQYSLDNLDSVYEYPGANEFNFIVSRYSFSKQNGLGQACQWILSILHPEKLWRWMRFKNMNVLGFLRNKHMQITQVAKKVLWSNKSNVVIWLKSEFRNIQLHFLESSCYENNLQCICFVGKMCF